MEGLDLNALVIGVLTVVSGVVVRIWTKQRQMKWDAEERARRLARENQEKLEAAKREADAKAASAAEQQRKDMERQREELEQHREELHKEIRDEAHARRNQLQMLEGNIEIMRRDRVALEQSLNNMRHQIGAQQEENIELKKQIARLERTVQVQQAEIESRDREILLLRKQVEDLGRRQLNGG